MIILQLIAGAGDGGAETFFTRLVPALHADGLTQIAAIRHNERRAEILEQSGVETCQLPYRGMLDLYTPLRIKQLAALKRPDIVMSWMNRASRMIPVGSWLNIGRLGGYYNLKYYRKCDYLICNTPDICDYVIKQGWPGDKVQYISNFVDERRSCSVDRKLFNTPAKTPLILTAGRLHKNKGIDVLIKAIACLDEAHLWVAGDGPLMNDLKKLVADLGIVDRVSFLGWRNDINALIASADIFVCPSRHEPLGNVVLEAWAQRIPIVAAAAQGPRQLIDNGETGILVPVDDHSALADKILLLINDDNLRKSIIDKANKKYMKDFSQEKIIAEYKKFFEFVTDH